jgi:hypothetical protein
MRLIDFSQVHSFQGRAAKTSSSTIYFVIVQQHPWWAWKFEKPIFETAILPLGETLR